MHLGWIYDFTYKIYDFLVTIQHTIRFTASLATQARQVGSFGGSQEKNGFKKPFFS